jgi:uncharacterized protein
MPQTCLYLGQVMHARLRPFRHRFAYRVFSMLVDLDELPELGKSLRLFAYNGAGLFSFQDRDHGARDGSSTAAWVRARLAEAGLAASGAKIYAQCFPRLLGYAFNPLTMYFCYRADGVLEAVLYEVKNTFGDQHGYLIPVDPARDAGTPIVQRAEKNFHVSPFIGMRATYRFRIDEPEDRLAILIRQSVPEGELLVATHTADRAPFTDAGLAKAFVAYPLLTLKVIVGIHWEALKLWFKGAKYHPRPEPPAQMVETAGSDAGSMGHARG